MSYMDRFGDGEQLKIEHDTQYGFICVSHPGHRSAAPELCLSPCTLNITVEDFVTMLKWYVEQKDKDENADAIKWPPCDFRDSQEIWDAIHCLSDIRAGFNLFNSAESGNYHALSMAIKALKEVSGV